MADIQRSEGLKAAYPTTPEHHAVHVVPKKTYFIIAGLLLFFTVLTAFISTIDLGPFSAVVAVAIACTKAVLIAMFFMHIKWSDRVTRLALFLALIFLAIMFALTSSDFFTRSWSTYGVQ